MTVATLSVTVKLLCLRTFIIGHGEGGGRQGEEDIKGLVNITSPWRAKLKKLEYLINEWNKRQSLG